MIRMFKVRIGNFMFENWHLYKLTKHESVNKKLNWLMWDKVI